MNSEMPLVPGIGLPSGPGQHLLADLEEERYCSEDLIEQMQTVRNELPDIAAMLERIYEDSERHRSEIRDMLMRSDPQSVWPA